MGDDKKGKSDIARRAMEGIARCISATQDPKGICNSNIGACARCGLASSCKIKPNKLEEEKTNTFLINNTSH